MKILPQIMVAPNGARLTKADHPKLPVTIAELIDTAIACHIAGAGAMHAHVRDEHQRHVLDAGLYRELLDEMAIKLPQMPVQITTEAVGQYSPRQQRELVQKVLPKAVSVSVAEMFSDDDLSAAKSFYHWCDEASVTVQHILYSPADLKRFIELNMSQFFPHSSPQLLFVLGRYGSSEPSQPQWLDAFLQLLSSQNVIQPDWAVCAFGQAETECLHYARKRGGKSRIGFENSLYHQDGSIAADNVERIRYTFTDLADHSQ